MKALNVAELQRTGVTTTPAQNPTQKRAKFQVRGVEVFYGAKRALHGIDLDVGEREVTALIGPSGCGKSTFLRCLNRMNDAIPGCRVQGSILLDDMDVNARDVDPVELRARVGSMLRRDDLSRHAGLKTEESPQAVTAGRLVLDPTKHELRRDGVLVALRPREFGLLEYLMRHPEQVLTRDQILESVWGITYRGETRTVDVHVRWLREKIEDEPARPEHIQTVRSIGYKFVP